MRTIKGEDLLKGIEKKVFRDSVREKLLYLLKRHEVKEESDKCVWKLNVTDGFYGIFSYPDTDPCYGKWYKSNSDNQDLTVDCPYCNRKIEVKTVMIEIGDKTEVIKLKE